ncbi:MAG: tetratricopeptide repeat protein [Desulfobacteraceae bacterium]|nr:tetratricopeptide repeat protein [Desulfobacteraceae bacterium]
MSETFTNLGNLYYLSNRYGDAEKAYNKALEINEKLSIQNPKVFEIQLCNLLINFGIFQADLFEKEPKQAYKTKGLSYAERAIYILSKYPDVPQAQDYMKRAIDLKQKLENPPVIEP